MIRNSIVCCIKQIPIHPCFICINAIVIADTVIAALNVSVFNYAKTTFNHLGIQDKYLEKTTLIRSTLPPGSYKTSLDTSPPPNILSLHELDGQPSSLLVFMLVLNYNASFSPAHLFFLELEDIHEHLDFEILENNNEVIPIAFYLQLLNKQ